MTVIITCTVHLNTFRCLVDVAAIAWCNHWTTKSDLACTLCPYFCGWRGCHARQCLVVECFDIAYCGWRVSTSKSADRVSVPFVMHMCTYVCFQIRHKPTCVKLAPRLIYFHIHSFVIDNICLRQAHTSVIINTCEVSRSLTSPCTSYMESLSRCAVQRGSHCTPHAQYIAPTLCYCCGPSVSPLPVHVLNEAQVCVL